MRRRDKRRDNVIDYEKEKRTGKERKEKKSIQRIPLGRAHLRCMDTSLSDSETKRGTRRRTDRWKGRWTDKWRNARGRRGGTQARGTFKVDCGYSW